MKFRFFLGGYYGKLWDFYNVWNLFSIFNGNRGIFLLNSARTLVTLVLVGYELHENFSKHIGKLVCRHGAKPCNKETELLGTLKASITTT